MKIIIEPYNPEWPEKDRVFKENISALLGSKALAIEHIGSTSIIGMSAKPVIDIQVGTIDTEMLNAIVSKMIDGGYTYIKKYEHLMSQRRYFVFYRHPDLTPPPDVLENEERNLALEGFINLAHIHCWVYGNDDWIRHIAFRDYLCNHPKERMEYQQMKEQLAEREWESSLAYSEAKNEFIQTIQAQAMDWYFDQIK